MQEYHEELTIIAIKEFREKEDMYKVVDFLNKNLKSRGIIFGLKRKDSIDVISIYNIGENE